MTNYTITNTFINSEISARRYKLIWISIIERGEKSSAKSMDNYTPPMI